MLTHLEAVAVCGTAGDRASQIIISIVLLLLGAYLFYQSKRGKPIHYLAVIPKDAVLWTRITVAFLVLIGAGVLFANLLC